MSQDKPHRDRTGWNHGRGGKNAPKKPGTTDEKHISFRRPMFPHNSTMSSTALMSDPKQAMFAGKYCESWDVIVDNGTAVTVNNKSITYQQCLKLFRQKPVEVITIHGKQLEVICPDGYDPITGDAKTERRWKTGKMIDITDEKVVRMSDRSLLRQGNPFPHIEREKIRRQTSVSGVKRYDDDQDFSEPERIDMVTMDVTGDPDFSAE